MKFMHFQVVDKNCPSLVIHGKGTHSTITGHLGRHSLQCLAFGKGVFKDGKIGMGVDIDKTRGDNKTIRFNDRFSSVFYER
jgi:hypothetical protein